MQHMLQTNRFPVRQIQLKLLLTCLIPVRIWISVTDTESFLRLRALSFSLKRSTNHGKRDVPAPYFCPSDSLLCIRTFRRLPAGNWVFQGRRLNSSFWLCWGKECHSFSSSLFLGQGCKRGTKHSRCGISLSQWSKSDKAQKECNWSMCICKSLFPINQSMISPWALWRTLISAPLSSLPATDVLSWIDEFDACVLFILSRW